MFGGDALSLTLYELGDVAGGDLMEVWNVSRKTFCEKGTYNGRVTRNRRIGYSAFLPQVVLKLPQNNLAGARRR
jgi:hypothetical protein